MAAIRKHRERWQAQIRIKGIRPITKSFEKKSDALRWSRAVEGEIATGSYVDPRKAESTLLSDAIDQYVAQLDSKGVENSARRSRLKRLRSDLGDFSLAKLGSHQLAEYRDRRIKVVSATTVSHELALLRHILGLATREWGIQLPHGLPSFPKVKLPHGRTRRLSSDEESQLLVVCEDDPQLSDLILLAIETGMRRGELVNIRPSDVDSKNAILTIPKTKAGHPRVIPLSPTALSILERQSGDKLRVIDLAATAASQKFAAACRKAGIKDLRLHDLRHEAISRFVELGLSTLEVAAISGHKTITMLQRYSHPSPEKLARKLAG
jgi:integrase